ncbi:hypothetical protein B4N89_27865 [Embleya scabrispora]|uniref:Capsid maturation protease n=1 Tax=Embleya scabrispora TaxID=159449 RepID=A0A1T3P567_9ACTN|nr:hypothetical protein [Embleya scabrispora]OPC84237.1 hypothetical protein B4N89_27865 [Embleya scabrispora]
MARRISDGSSAARRLRTQQRGMLRMLFRDIRARMRTLDPARPASARPWIAGIATEVDRYAQIAAELSARAYEAEREAAGLRSTFRPALADSPPAEQIEATMRWAAHDVWTPPDPEPSGPADGRPHSARIAERLLAGVQQRAEAAAGRLALDAGRRTIVEAVEQDPDARGWYRSAQPTACAFCRLMASRGAVYKTRGTAGTDANENFTGEGLFKFHNDCACVALPVLRGDVFSLSPEATEWDRIYFEFASGHPGDQLRRYRIAMRLIDQGRTPTPEDFGDRP